MKTREKLLFVYTQALERGDIETVAQILEQAADDPVLGAMVMDLNQAMEDNLAPQTSKFPLFANWKYRLAFVAAMVAVIAVVLLIFKQVTDDIQPQQAVQTVAFAPTQGQRAIDFEADITSVDALLLMTRSEQVPVQWKLEPPLAQVRIVFAQVIPNNALLTSVEISQTQFDDGTGRADLAPILPAANAEEITLLVQAIDPSSGTIYASRAITIPIQVKTESIEDDENCDEEPFHAGLEVNETGTVKSEVPLPLYNSNGIGDEVSGFVDPEETVVVLDGPYCFFTVNDGAYVRQWFVRSEATSAEGWLFEAYNSRQIPSPTYFLYRNEQ